MLRGFGILPPARKNSLAGSVPLLPAADSLRFMQWRGNSQEDFSLPRPRICFRAGRSGRCLARSNSFRAVCKTPEPRIRYDPLCHVWVKVSLALGGCPGDTIREADLGQDMSLIEHKL